MGSGFHETSTDHGKLPEVPVAIVNSIRGQGLLTMKPEVALCVNPIACQAIATTTKPLQARGITIRPTDILSIVFGEGAQRTLHAKFLFSANNRDNSNACTSAGIYLGSGNLTHPGFANKMSACAANREVGVVFAPNSLYWEETTTTKGHQVVTNLLPIQWDNRIGDATPLAAGSDMEQRDTIYFAPPVVWLKWHKSDGVSELRTRSARASDCLKPKLIRSLYSTKAVGFSRPMVSFR
jgi:hypothetical protein